MMKFAFAAAVALFGIAGSSLPVAAQSSNAYRSPDFNGRDKAFAHIRTKILEGLRSGPNFAGHFTIVVIGCGTGCTSNYIVDRKTGKISAVPWGGEIHNMLDLRFSISSAQITAAWLDGDMCTSQSGQWNGSAFEITSSPRGRPNSFCER